MEALYFGHNSLSASFLYFFFSYTFPLFQNICDREREEKQISATVVSSSQLPFEFLKHTPRLIASKLSLNVFSFALWLILIVNDAA